MLWLVALAAAHMLMEKSSLLNAPRLSGADDSARDEFRRFPNVCLALLSPIAGMLKS